MNQTLHKDTIKSEEQIDVLRFSLDKEEYGIELLKVLEVIRLSQITKLPKSPSFVKGIINLRGMVVPIIDLREKFAIPTLEYTSTTRAIIIEVEKKQIGVIVDYVSQVVKISINSIQESPSFGGSGTSDYIDGVCEFGEILIILLKIEKILSEDEVIELEKVHRNLGN